MTRLLRVRRLMEEISRSEFAARHAEQMTIEVRRQQARQTALALRGKARLEMERMSAEADSLPGVWQRYLEESEVRTLEAGHWDGRLREAAEHASEAQRQYLEDRRDRMQAEVLVQEKLTMERREQERREQREIDDWFGMGRPRREK